MPKSLRFVIVPKVAHPWFDEVNKGAQTQAQVLSRELSAEIVVDYVPPSTCDIAEQNAVLKTAALGRPTGIAVDPVDAVCHMDAIHCIRDQGIPLLLFDSPSPAAGITSVGNNFSQQGIIASERLANLIGYTGKVAVMQGYPAAPNHKQRYDAQLEILRKYPILQSLRGARTMTTLRRPASMRWRFLDHIRI
jgi:ribose transport system substrate-binding protein